MTTPVPAHGWPCAPALNGRVLPWGLDRLNENALLRGGQPTLYPLGSGPQAPDAAKPPALLVHGVNDDPGSLQLIANRLSYSRYQVYVLCYDDQNVRTQANGYGFAAEIRRLKAGFMRGSELAIVAHSMGGIIARVALNDLQLRGGLQQLAPVRFVAIDTPWHGFSGPADGLLMSIVSVFMPDGIEDMRAESPMFRGHPQDPNPTGRAGLFGVQLPGSVHIDHFFAANGSVTEDYTEGSMAELQQQLVNMVVHGSQFHGSTQQAHFYRALHSSYRFRTMWNELHGRRIDRAAARQALERHFPRFPGDHKTVLRNAQLLDALSARLQV